jgi:hypothetical protein
MASEGVPSPDHGLLGFPARPGGSSDATRTGRQPWIDLADDLHDALHPVEVAIRDLRWSGQGRDHFDEVWQRVAGAAWEADAHLRQVGDLLQRLGDHVEDAQRTWDVAMAGTAVVTGVGIGLSVLSFGLSDAVAAGAAASAVTTMEGACAALDRAAAADVRTLLEAAQAARQLAGRLAVQPGTDLPVGEPLDGRDPVARLADLPVSPPLFPLALPDQDPRDVAGDYFGGLRDEVAGTVDGVAQAIRQPMDTARGLLGMLENPGEALRAMIDWEDLESGHPGRWAGHMLPGVPFGAVTDGAGFLIRAARLLHGFALEAETLRTLSRQIGALEARLLVRELGPRTTDDLMRVMMPAEIRRFVDELGVARVRELVQRYSAESVAYYGIEFFKLYQGVTDDLMKHVVTGERIKEGKIVGCHDRANFVAAIRGNGEIVNEMIDSHDPDLSVIEYRLYRRSPRGGIEQPPSLRPKVHEKTVVRSLDPQRWRRLATEAADSAIRNRSFPKDGHDVIRAVTNDGTDLLLYCEGTVLGTFHPIVRPLHPKPND